MASMFKGDAILIIQGTDSTLY